MSFVADLTALVAASRDQRLGCPSGWVRTLLGDVATIVNGFPFKSDGFGNVGHPVIRIRDVNRGFTNTRFNGDAPDAVWVEPGDLIVGMDGDFQTAFWRSERALLNQRVCQIKPDKRRLDMRFLAYALPAYLALINENTPSVTVKHLSSRTLAAIPLSLPDIDTQQRVVTRIDEMFAEIDDGEAALALARADLSIWRKALLKAAVTGELTADWRAANPPTETSTDFLARIRNKHNHGRTRLNPERQRSEPSISVEDLPSIPSTWSWTTLGAVGAVTGGLTKNAKRDSHKLRLPYLRVGNVYAGRLDITRIETIGVSESEIARASVRVGDLLIVEGNGSIDQIGRSAIWTGIVDPCLHQNHLIKIRFDTDFLNQWIQFWLQSPWGRKELERQASSTSGLHTLSISKISVLRCPVPAHGEIEAIISLVTRLLAESDAGDDDMNTLKSGSIVLRQSILNAAFRGDFS